MKLNKILPKAFALTVIIMVIFSLVYSLIAI